MNSVEYPLTFCHAYGTPSVTGVIRSVPEDFQVDELLGFEAEGKGEYFLIQIRKKNTNTEWLARQLAKFTGVKAIDVSYAGLKDRNAVTTQWFSIRIPGLSEPDWKQFSTQEYQILQARRHSRKLRRGALKANRFIITIRDLAGDFQSIEQRLQLIKKNGVPNYFGEQRFGINGDNLKMADMMFSEGKKVKNRHKRSMYLSAARSFLFNQVCSSRVETGSWKKPLAGDAMILCGTHSFFTVETIDDEIIKRVKENDILPSGPLWGKGRSPVLSEVKKLEEKVLAPYMTWCEGLEQYGLKHERRSLGLVVNELQWEISQHTLTLEFILPPGSYATSVLREVVNY